MPKAQDADPKQDAEPKPEKKQFMRETIGKPPLTRWQMFRRRLLRVLGVVLLGVVAGASFAVASTLTQRYILPRETIETAPPITIPKDEPDTTASSVSPTGYQTSGTSAAPVTSVASYGTGSAVSGGQGTAASVAATTSAGPDGASGQAGQTRQSRDDTGSDPAGTSPDRATGQATASPDGAGQTGASGQTHPTAAGSPGTSVPETSPIGSEGGEDSPESADGADGADASGASGSLGGGPAGDGETVTDGASGEDGGASPAETGAQDTPKSYTYTMEDYILMQGNLRKVVDDVERGIVEVHSVSQELDWFDNPLMRTGIYAGLVINATPKETLILVTQKAVEHADSIEVTFGTSTTVPGKIKQMDKIIGMAVVSVDSALLPTATFGAVKSVPLGNSYSVRQGDLILAMGSPTGWVHSACYGEISYIFRSYPRTDGICRLFLTDVETDVAAGTFLINTKGEMVGWFTDIFSGAIASNLPIAIAVSEYKGIIEKLSNGSPAPYLGVLGQDVGAAVAETGVPLGVYVSDSIADGPAYVGGVKNGDVITGIDGHSIGGMRDLQAAVEALGTGDEITVTVKRNSVDEYKELEFDVVLGAR
ncbi:MAG: PDZ domain-containing protein [Lachnospiraceae bacterium]|jgi:S1-C subfamily serine protease|nr:PDZ domain-containing protein [Lachnospiraceae bacterium]